ncbi:hypothetical protein NKH77_19435 [Streptomyces sp. M19]
MIATTATGDMMQANPYYRAMAPDDSREADMELAFLKAARIVRDGSGRVRHGRVAGGGPGPGGPLQQGAGRHDRRPVPRGRPSADVHPDSSEQGSGGVTERDVLRMNSTAEEAEQVCRRLADEPRTVVYWAARAQEFGAFLNDFYSRCGSEGSG